MSKYQFRKAMRILDHAINHLGPTKPCGLLICDGIMSHIPGGNSSTDAARAILVNAMLRLVKIERY